MGLTVASTASAMPFAAPTKLQPSTSKKAKKAPATEKAAADKNAKSGPETPETKVAQADPAPAPAPEPAPAPAEPAPAPAAEPAPKEPPPSTTTPDVQPAVTLGGSTAPTTDQPSGANAEKDVKKPERRWAGSSLINYNSMTTATVFKGQTQYNDPTVDSSIWLLPRFNLNDSFQLRGRVIFSYEYTNSDTTVTKNEPRFSDTTVQLVYKKIPEFAKIHTVVGVQVGLPTSPESRAKTMIFSPGLMAGLARTFEKVGPGQIDVAIGGIYAHPVYNQFVPEARATIPYAVQCAGSGDCTDPYTGTLNASDVLAYTASIGYKIGKVTPNLFYLGSSSWAYHPKDATVPIAGGQSVSVADGCSAGVSDGTPGCQGRSSVRQAGYFAAAVDYEFTPWITGELGYSLYRNFLTENGTYGNPFADRYQDMRVFLGAIVDPDELFLALQGKAREVDHNPDGVPRKTNARMKRPVMTY
ncbi:MAG TPA: hypothetical protein VIF62_28690 [Labilithrix sp.]